MQHWKEVTSILAVTGLAASLGCQPQTPPPATPAPANASAESDHGHEHELHGEGYEHAAGPHGGTIADWGGGKYHVEFTVDHDKQEATVYVLGSDEKTPAPVKTVDGTLLLTILDPVFTVDLNAAPLDGETDGQASRYTGTHESLGIVRDYTGSMSAEVDGTPYSGDFREEAHGEHAHGHSHQ